MKLRKVEVEEEPLKEDLATPGKLVDTVVEQLNTAKNELNVTKDLLFKIATELENSIDELDSDDEEAIELLKTSADELATFIGNEEIQAAMEKVQEAAEDVLKVKKNLAEIFYEFD